MKIRGLVERVWWLAEIYGMTTLISESEGMYEMFDKHLYATFGMVWKISRRERKMGTEILMKYTCAPYSNLLSQARRAYCGLLTE